LEHAERDLDTIRNWRCGTFWVCGVPDFDDPTHVRFFDSEQEVRDRYSSLFAIDRVVRVRRPAISNIGLRSRLRALRWIRYRPTQIMRILGIGTIEQFGCWYLFVGRKH
jgi:hypothetical protein